MIEDSKRIFTQTAGDYVLKSTTDLANMYCDAEEAGNEFERSKCYSALMLRYWYKIYEWVKTCKSLKLEIDDFVSWIQESLDWAFRYRRWRDPTNALYTDPNGPDKVFKRCLFSTRGRHYQESNKDLRKVNYLTDSIEAGREALGDAYDLDAVEDDSVMDRVSLIQYLVKNHRCLDALIVDGIMNYDCFNENKIEQTMSVYNEETEEYDEDTYDEYSHTFNVRKLVKHLKTVDENFISSFMGRYQLNAEQGSEVLNKIINKSPTTIKKCVDKTLYNLRSDTELLKMCCA